MTARHYLDRRPLSACEYDIMDRVCEGKSNKMIARDRGRSYHTIKRQLEDIYVKLGVQNRTEAAGAVGEEESADLLGMA